MPTTTDTARVVTVTNTVTDLARAFEAARQLVLREPSNERNVLKLNAAARELCHAIVPEILT